MIQGQGALLGKERLRGRSASEIPETFSGLFFLRTVANTFERDKVRNHINFYVFLYMNFIHCPFKSIKWAFSTS